MSGCGNNSCGCGPQPSRALRRAPRGGDVVDPRLAHRHADDFDDEGPSQADIERFSDPTRTCPECKTEVYDDTDVCWNCGHAFRGELGKMPAWVIVAAVLVIAAFVVFLFA